MPDDREQRLKETAPWERDQALVFIGQIRLLLRQGGTGTIHFEYTRGKLKGVSTMHKQQMNEDLT